MSGTGKKGGWKVVGQRPVSTVLKDAGGQTVAEITNVVLLETDAKGNKRAFVMDEAGRQRRVDAGAAARYISQGE